MKYSHLLALSLSFSLFACSKPVASTAQPTPTPVVNAPGTGGGDNMTPEAREARRHQRIAQMQTTLGLTDDQTQKITALFDSQRPAMEALRNDQTLTRDQKREKMQAMRQTIETQMATILTPDQKAKWDAERAQWQANRPDAAASPAAQ